MRNKKGSSIIILVFSIMALLGLCTFALDLGLILNQRYELQKAVESAALLAASEYEIYETGGTFIMPTQAQITTNATSHYDALVNSNQFITGFGGTPTINVNPTSRAVSITADATVPTYLLAVLGVKEINIQAAAAAVNLPVYLSSTFPKPGGSILQGAGATFKDMDIKQPLGSVTPNTGTITVYNQNTDIKKLYGQPDGKVLSLGPGGYITLRLPTTLVNGNGFDFAIYERGHAEGYFVYAGIDTNPNDPYVDASDPGGGISWVNISCTGTPLYVNINTIEMIGSHMVDVPYSGATLTTHKFYGSGLFDLGAKCTNGGVTVYDGTDPAAAAPKISNVKYIRIIDDNKEDGFFIQPPFGGITPSAIPTLLPGEHSTITPGADIDGVEIYHHSRLISLTDYATDTDTDGLIDVLERMLGFDPNDDNTDGDTINDNVEYIGTVGSSVLYKDYPTWTEVPPTMEVQLP
ncbi:MAG: hypothetical protein A2Y25_01915 [Candidatus Melainabacteria bacterium GWF2_37_15]|nr:MAG: hypothetical protein A2Y25_01915 [Candidatus Melainabacteria bacterium GWF2_37_15]